MTDRLIELLKAIGHKHCFSDIGSIADHLIANDVTVNEWHPASELPKEDGSYLVFVRSNNGRHCWQNVCKFSTNLTKVHKDDFKGKKRPGWYSYDGEWGYYEIDGITHWRYLPENPKEATNE